MAIRSLAELPVAGRRVFVRVDFDVPLTPAKGVADDTRIRAALPTIRHLLERGARLILASHLGRPGGKPDPACSLEPVAARLAELIERDVVLTDEPVGDGARKVVSDLRDGGLVLLENLRFADGEEANDDGFARALAAYAEIYVNDAFGAAHRAHASTVGMVRHLPIRGAGLLMRRELEHLGRLLGTVERPYVAVIGGAKVSDKLALLDSLLGRVDALLIGGAMANTFLKARGFAVGRSKVEEGKLTAAAAFLRRAEERRTQVLLPVDLVCALGLDVASGEVRSVAAVDPEQMALDLGPETRQLFAERIAKARTVFWNGPVGVFERPAFAAGTLAMARVIAACPGHTVVGGGDSLAAVRQAGVGERITHLSTGGGAALVFIEGKALPGLHALESEGAA